MERLGPFNPVGYAFAVAGMVEQFQHGGGADIEYHQKSLALPFEQWRRQGRIFEGGAKQGNIREGARGKIGGSIGGKLQNGDDARVRGIYFGRVALQV